MKFLIDECLSPSLVEIAVATGFPGSSHVVHRGMAGWDDHKLMPKIIKGDWTFVTQDSDDFRPRRGSSVQNPCYVGQPLHKGLVCLNLPIDSKRACHQAYFRVALKRIGTLENLVNQILEIDPHAKIPGKVKVRCYAFPNDEN